MNKFLVISYKTNSDDYCRGCYKASYDSDCIIQEFTNEKEVVEHISDLDSKDLRVNEIGYEHTVYTIEPESEIHIDCTQATADKILLRRQLELEESNRKLEKTKEDIRKKELKKLEELKAKYE